MLCKVCLNKNHQDRDCKSKSLCFTCKKRHHSSLCNLKNKLKTNNFLLAKTTINTLKETQEKTQITSINESSIGNKTFLPTTNITIINPDNGNKLVVNAFFDTGSEISCIRKDIGEKLNLIPYNTKKIEITTFGQIKTTNEHNFYKINLKQKNHQIINISVMETETITNPF